VIVHDAAEVSSRLQKLRREIASVERSWTHPVEVVAVTKGFAGSAIESAVLAGCTTIGENYAQELIAKRDVIAELQPVVYFIGRLQSNKVRQLVGLVDVWSTIDRDSIVDEVAKRAPGARILIQVNSTGEGNKGGCAPDDVPKLVDRAAVKGLHLEGLMTIGPTGEPPQAARRGFRLVRSLVDDLGLETCSMGMTADVAVALEEGSTQIRIGTALFGERPLRTR